MESGMAKTETEALEQFSHSLSNSLFNLLTPLIFSHHQPLSPNHLLSLCQSFSTDISFASSLLISAFNHFHSNNFPINHFNSLPSAPFHHPLPPPSSHPFHPPHSTPLPSRSPLPLTSTTPTHSPTSTTLPTNRPVGSYNSTSVSKSLSPTPSRSHLLGDLFDLPCHKTANGHDASSSAPSPPSEPLCPLPPLTLHPAPSDLHMAAPYPAPKDRVSPAAQRPGALVGSDGPACLPDGLCAYIQHDLSDELEQPLSNVAVEEAQADFAPGFVQPCSADAATAEPVTNDVVNGLRRELEAFGDELERQFERHLLARYEQRLAEVTIEFDKLRGASEVAPAADGGARHFEEYRDSLEKRVGSYGARLKAELEEWKATVLETRSKTGDAGELRVLMGRLQKLEGTVAKALTPNALRTHTLAALGLVPSAQQRANLQVFLSQLEAHWARARAKVEAEEVIKALNESLALVDPAGTDTHMQDGWTKDGEKNSNNPLLATSASLLVNQLIHAVVRKGLWPELGPLVDNLKKYLCSQGFS